MNHVPLSLLWHRCLLQGLLFKVNGVSANAPVYESITAIMLSLCVVFVLCWLVVVAENVAKNVLATQAGAGLRQRCRLLRRAIGKHGPAVTKWSDQTAPQLPPSGSATAVPVVDQATSGPSGGGCTGVAAPGNSPSSGRWTTVNPLCGQRIDGLLADTQIHKTGSGTAVSDSTTSSTSHG